MMKEHSSVQLVGPGPDILMWNTETRIEAAWDTFSLLYPRHPVRRRA